DIKRLEQKIEEIKGMVQKLSEKENSQFTDIMTEIRKVAETIKEDSEEYDDGAYDDLYDEAEQVVVEEGKASTSFLQRKLGIGYSRASSLIDALEEGGVIGPNRGATPREILKKSTDAKTRIETSDDDLYEEAKKITIEAGKVSTSYLQRKLGTGYARSARLIDMLEEQGVIEAGSGAKPRKVLKNPSDKGE
ncbi:MAG: DNA translocase FtsK, partial [Nitrospira sp.]